MQIIRVEERNHNIFNAAVHFVFFKSQEQQIKSLHLLWVCHKIHVWLLTLDLHVSNSSAENHLPKKRVTKLKSKETAASQNRLQQRFRYMYSAVAMRCDKGITCCTVMILSTEKVTSHVTESQERSNLSWQRWIQRALTFWSYN